MIQADSPSNRAACVQLAEAEQPVKYRAVLSNIEPLQLAHVFMLIIRGDKA